MTTHDAEWLPGDRGFHLAWAAEQALICPGCGQPRDETMADEKLGPVPDYQATSARCRGCHTKAAGAAEMAGRDEIDPLTSVYWSVQKAD